MWRQLDSRKRERLVVLYLKPDMRLVGRQAWIGQRAKVAMNINALCKNAMLLEAHGLIVGHNHPAGPYEASPADVKVTRELAIRARMCGLKLHDHLIFVGDFFLSMMREGLV